MENGEWRMENGESIIERCHENYFSTLQLLSSWAFCSL